MFGDFACALKVEGGEVCLGSHVDRRADKRGSLAQKAY